VEKTDYNLGDSDTVNNEMQTYLNLINYLEFNAECLNVYNNPMAFLIMSWRALT
jgi:hypothetical protein